MLCTLDEKLIFRGGDAALFDKGGMSLMAPCTEIQGQGSLASSHREIVS